MPVAKRPEAKPMKHPLRSLAYFLLITLNLALCAQANDLIQDGEFDLVTSSGSAPLTTKFGEFGTGTGSTLTVGNWSTTGYNFVYAPDTADSGTASGANAGQPNEAPGQFNASDGYGSTYLWGSNNGGVVTLPATDPAGGNFIAADGAFQTGAIKQTVGGLVLGQVYQLKFYWAAAQQQGYTAATTEKWQVSLGSQTFTTPTVNLASKGFSGWMQQSFDYTATSSSETLSFLAAGTPTGQPPFVLLGGVTMDVVPEPSTWLFFAGIGAAFTLVGVIRRRALGRTGELSR